MLIKKIFLYSSLIYSSNAHQFFAQEESIDKLLKKDITPNIMRKTKDRMYFFLSSINILLNGIFGVYWLYLGTEITTQTHIHKWIYSTLSIAYLHLIYTMFLCIAYFQESFIIHSILAYSLAILPIIFSLFLMGEQDNNRAVYMEITMGMVNCILFKMESKYNYKLMDL